MKKNVRILYSCAVAFVVFAIFCAVIIGCKINYRGGLLYLIILISIGAGKLVNNWLKTNNNNQGEGNSKQEN